MRVLPGREDEAGATAGIGTLTYNDRCDHDLEHASEQGPHGETARAYAPNCRFFAPEE